MPPPLPPRYSEWLCYLFDHETRPGLPEWYWSHDAPTFEATPDEIAELWIAMMKRSGMDLRGYTDEQLSQGLWYLFSNACSDHSHQIRDGGLPIEKVVEVYDSIFWLYRDLFSSRCTETLGHLCETGSALNSICYMLWDTSPLGWPPDANPSSAIEKALLNLLEQALHLPHRACMESALHGLGELHCRYASQVEPIIEAKLVSLALDTALLQYALKAQQGDIL